MQKALFQRAATLTGRTLSDLVVGSTQAAASRIVHDHDVIRLAQEDQIAFAKALLNPPPVSERLRRSLDNSRVIGAMAVIVDAKDRQAERFYQHFGFLPFQQTPLPKLRTGLFLPMQQVAGLFVRDVQARVNE